MDIVSSAGTFRHSAENVTHVLKKHGCHSNCWATPPQRYLFHSYRRYSQARMYTSPYRQALQNRWRRLSTGWSDHKVTLKRREHSIRRTKSAYDLYTYNMYMYSQKVRWLRQRWTYASRICCRCSQWGTCRCRAQGSQARKQSCLEAPRTCHRSYSHWLVHKTSLKQTRYWFHTWHLTEQPVYL